MAEPQASTVDLRAFIDGRGFSPYQWLILVLCFCTVFLDGFDTSAVGFVAPALVQGWGVPRESLGPVLSAALVGLAVGALAAGPSADRFGRKTVLVSAVVMFGLASFGSAAARSIEGLTLLRLLTGLGLGAAMPNAVTLMSEYCPEPRRGLLVTTMFCGFTFGAALGGFIAAALMPRFGWPSVFVVGGAAPLALAILLLVLLPESARFLVVRGRPKEKVAAILARIAPDARESLAHATAFTVPEQRLTQTRHPIRTILSPPLLAGTLLLWAVFFCGLVVIFLLTSWLPILMKGAGFSTSTAAVITALFQLGGTAGAVLVAWAMDRFAPHKVLAASYALAALCLVAMSQSVHDAKLLAITVLAAGFFTSGAQTPVNAHSATFYPTQVRATGVSWMLGIGRFGAILGAYIAGPLLAWGWGFSSIIGALAVPALVAAAGMAVKGAIYRGRLSPFEDEAPPEPAAPLAPPEPTPV